MTPEPAAHAPTYHGRRGYPQEALHLPAPDLDDQIADAADQAGMTYSAWLAQAARKEFTLRAGRAQARLTGATPGPYRLMHDDDTARLQPIIDTRPTARSASSNA